MVFGIFHLRSRALDVRELALLFVFFTLHNHHTQTDKQISVTISFLPRGKWGPSKSLFVNTIDISTKPADSESILQWTECASGQRRNESQPAGLPGNVISRNCCLQKKWTLQEYQSKKGHTSVQKEQRKLKKKDLKITIPQHDTGICI